MAFNINPGKQAFTASAAQTDFDFNFKIYDGETDIKVYLTPVGQEPDDTADLLTFGTEYTVVIDGDLGGTVTLLSGATLNDTVVVLRDLPVTREISYVTQGDLLAATINIDQNYQTYLIIDGFVALAAALRLPDTAVGVATQLPAVVADAYLKWNAAGDAIENDTTIPDAVISAADSVLDANSWANEAENTPVKVYTNGVGADRVPTVFSAFHYQVKADDFASGAELEKWEAEANALTALSFATEAEDTPVNVVTSDGDGTFTYTPQAGVFSSLHYAAKAAVFNPALYALLTGATFTGMVKFAKGADVASASVLPTIVGGNYADVTGTTTITSIATTGAVGTIVKYHFDGVLTLSHHAIVLVLPGKANITTAAGDEAEFIEDADTNFRCTSYTKADGTSVIADTLSGVLTTDNFIHVQDQKATSTAGGSSSAGVNTRTLNTVVKNTITGASLGGNQVTLPIGDYYVEASAPCYNGDRNRVKIKDITGAVDLLLGTSNYASSASVSYSVADVSGFFTLGVSSALQLQHYISNATATVGLGQATSDGLVEVYGEVRIWKVG